MDGPYRGMSHGSCPRCNGPLFGDLIDRLECANGCGEWLTKQMLEPHISDAELVACEPDVGSLIGRPFPPARCAMCPRTMAVRIKYRAVFDHCIDHGVWLDRGEREPFEAAFDLWRKVDGD